MISWCPIDPGDAGICVIAGDRVLEHVAVAAVQLEAGVDHAPLRLGAPVLGHRRLLDAELADHVRGQRSVDERLGDLDLGLAFGQLEARVLERPDGLAERGSLRDIRQRPLKRSARPSDGADRDRQPLLHEALCFK